VTVTLQHPLYWKANSLHFTLDGSEPTAASPVYTEPFLLAQKTTVKAKEIDDGATVPASSQTVSADFDINVTTAPKVVSASALAVLPAVVIQFSSPVRKDQAETIGNYKFTPALEVKSAELSADGLSARLTLASPADAGAHELVISGISDISPNANAVASTPVALAIEQPVFSLATLPAGQTFEQTLSVLPVKGTDPWTINLFVKAGKQPGDKTVIAGFGRADDSVDGCGRYFCKFDTGIQFWVRHDDAVSNTPLDLNRWQMLTATYDGRTLQLFKNGKPISEQAMKLADDEQVVRIAPLDPWDHQRRFDGEISHFTIWNSVLPAPSLRMLAEAGAEVR
jgi:hypothetical protein